MVQSYEIRGRDTRGEVEVTDRPDSLSFRNEVEESAAAMSAGARRSGSSASLRDDRKNLRDDRKDLLRDGKGDIESRISPPKTQTARPEGRAVMR
jgi:hypothetical protein